MSTQDIHGDIIDTRDIIERIEELEESISKEHEASGFEDDVREFAEAVVAGDYAAEDSLIEEAAELATLLALMDDLKGNGGDEQWRGDWYPLTLIHEDHFVEAMQELCQDIGAVPADLPAYLVIDWSATAENLRADYTSVEFEGHTYWYR